MLPRVTAGWRLAKSCYGSTLGAAACSTVDSPLAPVMSLKAMPSRGDETIRQWAPGIEAIRQHLLRSDMLKDLPPDVIDKLVALAVPRGLACGDKLWDEGHSGHFAIVCRGQLEVRKNGGLIDIMLPSQALGHSAILGRNHTATVVAAVDAHVLCFDAARLLDLSRDHFAFIVAVLADRCALVSKLNGDLGSSKKPLYDRLCHHLAWLSRGKKQTVIDITHKQLAELTGSTHWSVSRELKKIEQLGAIRRGFQKIEILDMDPLGGLLGRAAGGRVGPALARWEHRGSGSGSQIPERDP